MVDGGAWWCMVVHGGRWWSVVVRAWWCMVVHGGDGGGGNNLPDDEPPQCARRGCEANGIRPISMGGANKALYCLACLQLKKEAKNTNRNKKRKIARLKKIPSLGRFGAGGCRRSM